MKNITKLSFCSLFAMLFLCSFSLKYPENFDFKSLNETTITHSSSNIETKNEIKLPVKPNTEFLKKSKNNKKSNFKLNKKNDERKNEGLGIAGFVLGIVGWFTPYLGFIMCLLALIFGAVSLGKIVKNPDKFKGKGFSITALIMGILGILINILLVSLIVSLFLI